MGDFSKKTWNETEDIYIKIINHPFNVEIANGTLPINKFTYYLEQDSLYLNDYYRCLSIISAKLSTQLALEFLKQAITCIELENYLHQYLDKNLKQKQINATKNMANLAYSSFILQTCYSQPVEIALASILPCFWIYNEVGKNIIKNTKNLENNPYKDWIETYSSSEFSEAVDSTIKIYNNFAENASGKVKEQMLNTYRTSAILEYHFWDKTYNRVDLFDI